MTEWIRNCSLEEMPGEKLKKLPPKINKNNIQKQYIMKYNCMCLIITGIH